MKQKNIFFLAILFLLISHSSLYSQYINFTQPTDNETVFITSGTSTNIVVNWTSSDKSGTVSSYVVLQTHNNSYSHISKPYTVYNVPAGNYSWTIKLYNIDGNNNTTYDSDQVNFSVDYQSYSITAENDMDGYTGGVIKTGVNQSAIQKTSPYSFQAESGNTVYLDAVENQSYNTYNWIWNDSEAPLYKSRWRKRYPNGSSEPKGESQNISFAAVTSDHNSTYEAGLRKECNIDFANQFSGTSYGGQIKINGGAWESAPTAQRQVVEQNQITAAAKDSYDISGIRYWFQKWSNNSSYEQTDFYPTVHTGYTAIYKGYPLFDENSVNGSLRNLTISAISYGYIELNWDEHPNTNVTQYRIYRHYKLGSYQSTPQLIGTVYRGTLHFTDYNYKLNLDGDYILYYDVKAYFAPDQTISSPAPIATRGDATNIAYKLGSDETITYYDISNYPNPYNPQTTIRFQLPQEGFVTIKVYNSIGEEIKTLLNEQKEYGKYELKFNGDDLPSGMYIYTIRVNDYYASKKMLLIK